MDWVNRNRRPIRNLARRPELVWIRCCVVWRRTFIGTKALRGSNTRQTRVLAVAVEFRGHDLRLR